MVFNDTEGDVSDDYAPIYYFAFSNYGMYWAQWHVVNEENTPQFPVLIGEGFLESASNYIGEGVAVAVPGSVNFFFQSTATLGRVKAWVVIENSPLEMQEFVLSKQVGGARGEPPIIGGEFRPSGFTLSLLSNPAAQPPRDVVWEFSVTLFANVDAGSASGICPIGNNDASPCAAVLVARNYVLVTGLQLPIVNCASEVKGGMAINGSASEHVVGATYVEPADPMAAGLYSVLMVALTDSSDNTSRVLALRTRGYCAAVNPATQFPGMDTAPCVPVEPIHETFVGGGALANWQGNGGIATFAYSPLVAQAQQSLHSATMEGSTISPCQINQKLTGDLRFDVFTWSYFLYLQNQANGALVATRSQPGDSLAGFELVTLPFSPQGNCFRPTVHGVGRFHSFRAPQEAVVVATTTGMSPSDVKWVALFSSDAQNRPAVAIILLSDPNPISRRREGERLWDRYHEALNNSTRLHLASDAEPSVFPPPDPEAITCAKPSQGPTCSFLQKCNKSAIPTCCCISDSGEHYCQSLTDMMCCKDTGGMDCSMFCHTKSVYCGTVN